MNGSSVIAAALPDLGAASIGAVVALIVVDRTLHGRPVGIQTRLRLAVWVTALAAGVTIETALFAGVGSMVWLTTGAALGGIARMAISNTWRGQP